MDMDCARLAMVLEPEFEPELEAKAVKEVGSAVVPAAVPPLESWVIKACKFALNWLVSAPPALA